MILFYTGSIKPNTPQKDPNLSLGGYISSSIVPNGSLNNLYPNIGLTDLKTNRPETRVIALTNITGADINGFQIWFTTSSTSFAKIELGVAQPMYDGECQCQFFEMLNDATCIPYYTTFASYEGQSNAYVFTGVFEKGATLGLFLQRSLISANNPDIGGNSSRCDTVYADWLAQQANPTLPQNLDDITMTINW